MALEFYLTIGRTMYGAGVMLFPPSFRAEVRKYELRDGHRMIVGSLGPIFFKVCDKISVKDSEEIL